MPDHNALLREQISHAYEHAPAFKQILDRAGLTLDDIATVADLDKIPVTTKDQLQAMQQENPPFGGFLAVPLSQLRRVYMSPGPIYDPEGHDDDAGLHVAQQAFQDGGFSSEDIVLNTFLYHMVPAGLLMDAALISIGATVVPIGPAMGFVSSEIHIKLMLDLGCTAYAGTPSFLEILLEKAEEMGLPKEALPLKKAFFSAEVYTPTQREKFENGYGLTTWQAYATADLGILAYEIPGHSGLYIPDHLIVQVCDPETGAVLEEDQPGEVVVTTFNKTYPLIRFGTGDLSILQTDGDRKKLLGLMGRSGEAIKVRGMFLHPNALKAALKPFSNIKKFQAVVERDAARDLVRLDVILKEGEIDSDAIKQAVKEQARLTLNDVAVVDSLEGTRTIRDARQYD